MGSPEGMVAGGWGEIVVGGRGANWRNRRGWFPRGWEPLQHKWGDRKKTTAEEEYMKKI